MKKTIGLVASLTAISAICATVLACVNAMTAGPIEETRKANELKAAQDVMPSVEGLKVEKISDGAFRGIDASGAVAGYAVKGRDAGGYGGDVVLMVGLEADRKTVVRYRKLEANETPGLGMKLVSPEFADQFSGKDAASLKVRKDGGEIDAITSATITSRAVCRAIEDACRNAAGL